MQGLAALLLSTVSVMDGLVSLLLEELDVADVGHDLVPLMIFRGLLQSANWLLVDIAHLHVQVSPVQELVPLLHSLIRFLVQLERLQRLAQLLLELATALVKHGSIGLPALDFGLPGLDFPRVGILKAGPVCEASGCLGLQFRFELLVLLLQVVDHRLCLSRCFLVAAGNFRTQILDNLVLSRDQARLFADLDLCRLQFPTQIVQTLPVSLLALRAFGVILGLGLLDSLSVAFPEASLLLLFPVDIVDARRLC